MAIATKRKKSPKGLTGDQYFNLIEHAADGIAIIQDGVFKLVNTALAHISGYDKKELPGMPFTRLLTPESQKLTMERYQTRLAGKKVPPVYEIKAVTKDGEVLDIEINAALTEYEGRIADEVIIRDITERKRAEEAFQTEKNKLESVIGAMEDGLSIQDKDYNIIYQNKAVRKNFGDHRGEKCYRVYEGGEKVCDGCPIEKAFRDGKSHTSERKAVMPSGEVTFWENTANPIRDARGDIVSCLEVTRNITERKKTEQALADEATRRRILVDQSLDGIVVLDGDSKVYEANQKFAEMLGYTLEEVHELHTWDWDKNFPPETLLEMGRNVDEKGLHLETRHHRKDGSVIDVDISINGAMFGGQKLIFCVCRDITERKRADEALQTEKNKLESVIGAMEDGLTIQDKDYNIIYQNEQSRTAFGHHPGEKCYRVYEGRDKVCEGCPVEEAFKDGKSHTAERSHVMPSGEVNFWENTANPVRDARGEVVSCLEVTRNITERKQAEQALADEATRRRILVDQSRDGIVILDQDGNVYEANKRFAEMLGYTPEETAKLHVWDWEYLYPRERVLEMIRTVDEAGDHFETQHRRKDGSVYDVEISTNGAICAGQKLIFCVCRDITERKRAEEKLRESEQYLKTLFDATTGGIMVIDPETHQIVDANPAIIQMIGVPREQIIGHVCHRFICPTEVGKCPITDLKQKIDTKECAILNAKGEEIPVLKSVVPIMRQGRQYLLELIFNITERKQAEDALRESEERYRAVIEGAHDMIQSVALDGRINFVNQAWLDTLGYTKIELPKLNLFEIIHPDSQPHCQEMFAKVISGEPVHNAQAVFLTKDGRKILVEGNATPRYIGDKVVATQGIFHDITERKHMEEQLQEKNEQLDSQNEELRAINEELRATEEELQQSQEKLERMFESVTDGIVVAALDGTILKVNESAVQMHGFATDDELLGKNTKELVAPSERERITNKMLEAQEVGPIRDQEYNLLRKDGSEFPAELSTSALKDASGKVIGRITIARDITERKQMEKLFRTVTNSSPVGIYIIQDKKFQLVNPQFQKLTGYTEDELLGMDSLALVLEEDRGIAREKAVKMLKGKLASPYQFRAVNKAGETRWVMETVTSIQYRGRRAILGNYMDITERRQAEEREGQLQQELNLAGRLASIGQLAAGVAHEINNPLTGVIGFSHLLLSRDIPEDMKQDLQVINSEAQRVAKIVENLLTFAHQRKTGQEYVDINGIIARVLELRAYEMKVNNIKVKTELAPDLPPTLADAGQLQQVFLNIILNAEHFMIKAHTRGKLQVKTERIGDNMRASFTDDGPGISPENLDKIFNPFFTTKEVGSGTGLGLSICHGIITQHKGRIYAQSKLGKGATFVVELPIVAEPAQPDKAKVTKKEPEKPRGAKILVVDDEPAILTFLRRLLTEWGHSAETINNANTALERLRTERYSLILLDIKLPGMSGIELYHHIEEIAPALTRRIMFITGDVMETRTREFLEKASVPHITKPLDIEVLKKMINHALNQTQVTAG